MTSVRPGAASPPRPELGEAAPVAALRSAADALAVRAGEAGLDARVPTCPRWRVADLVAHQGIVHRWAAGHLRLDEARTLSKGEVLRTVPRPQLLDWFAAGVAGLEEALAAAPPDVRAMVFLRDAPAPRAFWARRQAHETTIHSCDALAAVLGRRPSATEAGLGRDLAVDGLDELLTGFVTRGRSTLCTDAPSRLVVAPDDAHLAWVLDVAPDGITTRRTTRDGVRPPGDGPPDAVFHGSAAQLYLGLWNRGDEVAVDGDRALLDRWSARVHVRWS